MQTNGLDSIAKELLEKLSPRDIFLIATSISAAVFIEHRLGGDWRVFDIKPFLEILLSSFLFSLVLYIIYVIFIILLILLILGIQEVLKFIKQNINRK